MRLVFYTNYFSCQHYSYQTDMMTLLALLKGVLRTSLFEAHEKEPLQY